MTTHDSTWSRDHLEAQCACACAMDLHVRSSPSFCICLKDANHLALNNNCYLPTCKSNRFCPRASAIEIDSYQYYLYPVSSSIAFMNSWVIICCLRHQVINNSRVNEFSIQKQLETICYVPPFNSGWQFEALVRKDTYSFYPQISSGTVVIS